MQCAAMNILDSLASLSHAHTKPAVSAIYGPDAGLGSHVYANDMNSSRVPAGRNHPARHHSSGLAVLVTFTHLCGPSPVSCCQSTRGTSGTPPAATIANRPNPCPK